MGIASHIVRKEEGRPGLEPGRLGHNTSPGFLLSYPMPWQSYCEMLALDQVPLLVIVG